MSNRLRDPLRYVIAHGLEVYLHNLATEVTRRAPWSATVLEATGLSYWVLPTRARLAARHLRGVGLEIGAQSAPLEVPPGARVRYVDTMTREETIRIFPHLDSAKVVTPDYLTNGFTLEAIDDRSQDFLIANHVLEHSPDPIGALRNWMRVLRPGAILYVSVPLRDLCFDRGRELTSLGHMIEDFEVARTEGADALNARNLDHYVEWLTISNVNIARDEGRPALTESELATHAAWALHQHAEIHFHTFSRDTFVELLDYVGRQAESEARVVEVVPFGTEVTAIARRR